MSNTTLSYEWIKSLENQKESQNNLRAWSSNNFNHNITNQSEHNSNDIKLLWREMRPSSDPVSKLRTWETFGAPESSKQSLFFTDRSETTLHLARIRQACILSLLPKKVETARSIIATKKDKEEKGRRSRKYIAQNLYCFCYRWSILCP